MKKNLLLRLLTGFGVVAFITLVVGIIGVIGLTQTATRLKLLAREDMPAVSALNQMYQTALEMQTFIRSYALPHLTQEDRNNLIDVLAAIRKKRAA